MTQKKEYRDWDALQAQFVKALARNPSVTVKQWCARKKIPYETGRKNLRIPSQEELDAERLIKSAERKAKGRTKATVKTAAKNRLNADPTIKGKQRRFIEAFSETLDLVTACKKAGYSPYHGRRLLQSAKIHDHINKIIDQHEEQTLKQRERMMKYLEGALACDPNHFGSIRRTACRCCHSTTGLPMYIDQKDWFRSRPDDCEDEHPEGGYGYDPSREPDPDCGQCFGDGRMRLHFPDTTKLPEEAKQYLLGIEETKTGVKVRYIDRLEAFKLLQRMEGTDMSPMQMEELRARVLNLHLDAAAKVNNTDYEERLESQHLRNERQRLEIEHLRILLERERTKTASAEDKALIRSMLAGSQNISNAEAAAAYAEMMKAD